MARRTVGKANTQAESIFCAVIEIASAQERAAHLDRACGADVALRRHLEKLLAAHVRAGNFLGGPGPALATTDPPITEGVGDVIGPYKLLQQIGVGGFGVVFMADQQRPVRRKVALKVIKPGMDTHQVIARFEAERQALALMDHPNIARVLDVGATQSGRPYFVMELVKGLPVTEYCDQNQLTPRQRLELFVHVCQAVQHAHQKGIIHRDLKPSNVLVTEHDGTPVVKVIDFGIAKATGQQLTEKTLFTNFAQMIGTPLYMSPEQAGMSGLDVDTRSDIYSLGVLLYELLTGTTPFDKERLREASFEEIRRIIREEEPAKPSTRISTLGAAGSTVSSQRQSDPKRLNRLLRGDLDWIVMKSLEKDRTRRYETANEFTADVGRYLRDEPVLARPPSLVYRFRKFARRNKATLTMAGLVLFFFLLMSGSIGWIVGEHAERQATMEREVDRVLQESMRLLEQQRYPESLSAAKRAEALLASLEGGAEQRHRVRVLLKDLDMVALLEGIRLQQSELSGDRFDYVGADTAYAAAFRAYDLDVAAHGPPDAAALVRASAIRQQLVAAMDDWAWIKIKVRDREATPHDVFVRTLPAVLDRLRSKAGQEPLYKPRKDDAARAHLLTVARLADADEWRNRLRDPEVLHSWKSLEQLANRPEVATWPPTTVVLLARELLRWRAMPQALAILQQAHQQHPDDFWLNHELGTMCLSSKPPRIPEAIGFTRAELALRPRNPIAHCRLGQLLLREKRLHEATACFVTAVELKPDYYTGHIRLGDALMEREAWQESLAAYRQAIALQPTYFASHWSLAKALHKKGDLDDAITSYQHALRWQPKLAVLHHQLGGCWAAKKSWDEAVKAYREATRQESGNGLYWKDLGLALDAQGKRPEAVGAYKEAVKLAPNDANLHFHVGKALVRARQFDEAIRVLQKANELAPNQFWTLCNLGNAFRLKGNTGEAVKTYREAIRANPRMAQAHVELGLTFAARKSWEEAITAYQDAIRLQPGYAEAHDLLGIALWATGRREEAIAEYAEVVRLKPMDAKAHDKLARLLATHPDAKLRDPQRAVALAQHAVALPLVVAKHWNTLGIARFRNGDWPGTTDALRTSMSLNKGGDSFDWFFLAMTQWQLDRKDEARKWYDQAVEWQEKNQPKNAELRRFQREAAALLMITAEPPPKLD